ncbi:hypothetical protein [Chitinimonas taiwanensis]|uniref:hypothetical protein n=1 Tax=Chitinimonas taiwanensis TaxID=240412 RepID=UPI0035B00F61
MSADLDGLIRLLVLLALAVIWWRVDCLSNRTSKRTSVGFRAAVVLLYVAAMSLAVWVLNSGPIPWPCALMLVALGVYLLADRRGRRAVRRSSGLTLR